MRRRLHHLLNTADIEVWPAHLLRARSNQDARLLARASAVLRRKHDGLYLAAEIPEGLMPLRPRLAHEPGIDDALDALESFHAPMRRGLDVVPSLPLHRLQERLEQSVSMATPMRPRPVCPWWQNRHGWRSPGSSAIGARYGWTCKQPMRGSTCAMRRCTTTTCSEIG